MIMNQSNISIIGAGTIGTALGKVCRVVKFASTITGVSLSMDTSSTSVIKLYKNAFSDTALPTTDITAIKTNTMREMKTFILV